MTKVFSGLDVLLSAPDRYIKGKAIGLVVNHTSVASDIRHSVLKLQSDRRFVVKKLFAPEHGLYGAAQDMIGVESHIDPASGLETASLYGHNEASLTPKVSDLQELDALVFDIQDIGSRYYTFIYTMANCMETCRKVGVPIVICDRPNPIDGVHIEGNLVRKKFRSFVGQYAIPNRHGMTAGELARLFNDYFGIDCDLTVVPMRGWKRRMWFEDTGLPWVAPSPNMPTVATAAVYPGMCLLEGTHLSEGRGTTLPFEQFGAPYIDAHKLADTLNREKLSGVYFRPHYFKPTFHKWANQVCGGAHVHITDRKTFKAFLTGLAVLRAIDKLYADKFEWRKAPYEFEKDHFAIDLLYGNSKFREVFMRGSRSLRDIEASWEADLKTFKPIRKKYLLYKS